MQNMNTGELKNLVANYFPSKRTLLDQTPVTLLNQEAFAIKFKEMYGKPPPQGAAAYVHRDKGNGVAQIIVNATELNAMSNSEGKHLIIHELIHVATKDGKDWWNAAFKGYGFSLKGYTAAHESLTEAIAMKIYPIDNKGLMDYPIKQMSSLLENPDIKEHLIAAFTGDKKSQQFIMENVLSPHGKFRNLLPDHGFLTQGQQPQELATSGQKSPIQPSMTM